MKRAIVQKKPKPRKRTIRRKKSMRALDMNSNSKVKPTSRSSYYDHVVSGKAKSQRERILELLRTDNFPPHNRREISLVLRIPINAICGRVKALIDNGDVRVAYVTKDPQTNKRVEYLEFVHPEMDQARLF